MRLSSFSEDLGLASFSKFHMGFGTVTTLTDQPYSGFCSISIRLSGTPCETLTKVPSGDSTRDISPRHLAARTRDPSAHKTESNEALSKTTLKTPSGKSIARISICLSRNIHQVIAKLGYVHIIPALSLYFSCMAFMTTSEKSIFTWFLYPSSYSSSDKAMRMYQYLSMTTYWNCHNPQLGVEIQVTKKEQQRP